MLETRWKRSLSGAKVMVRGPAVGPALRMVAGLAVGLAAGSGCGSPAKNVLAEAAALEGQGKLEEAAAKLEMGCALSPAADPCPGSDAKAAETWQRAAEKAIGEGRYRDGERLLIRAMIPADDAAKAKIKERLQKPDLVIGLQYERAVGVADKAAVKAAMESIVASKAEAPAVAKANEWLAKERPPLLVAAVTAACGPDHAGSCTGAWKKLQASGAKGPEVDQAQALAEAEERRVYPLRVQAEEFLSVFVGRSRKDAELAKCLDNPPDSDSGSTPSGNCWNLVHSGTQPEDAYDAEKNQDTLFRRTLIQIADPELTEELESRRLDALTGKHVKKDIPKPKPAPKSAGGGK